MNPSCPDLRASIASLRTLAERFDVAMNASAKTGDYSDPKRLKSEIELATTAIEEQLVLPEIRELNLEYQYAEQYGVLESSGILEVLSNGEKGIRSITGAEYPIPSFEVVMAKFKEKQEVIKEKGAQGFTKMLLVPFGMSLNVLVNKYGELLKARHTKENLRLPDGTAATVSESLPIFLSDKLNNADTTGELIYDPISLTPDDQGGRTKSQILRGQVSAGDTAPGWRVVLMEDLHKLPTEAQAFTTHTRQQATWGLSSASYHSLLGKEDFRNESGLTPEEWLTLAISNLETMNEVTDDDQDARFVTDLVGAYLPEWNSVPTAHWSRVVGRQAVMDATHALGSRKSRHVRSSVRI